MKCPQCGSPHVTPRHAGEHAGGKLGALLGAAFGAASAMRGVRIGFAVGRAFGPAGAAAGGITGAVITGIFTGSAVSAFTAAVGSLFDREVLCDRECNQCGHAFRRFEGEFAPGSLSSARTDAPETAQLAEERGALSPIATPGGA